MERLNLFFSKIKELNFWQRLFGWSKVRSLSYDAFEEFKSLENEISRLNESLQIIKDELAEIKGDNKSLVTQLDEAKRQGIEKESRITVLNDKISGQAERNSEMVKKISYFESTEEQKNKSYEEKISSLNQAKQDLDTEKARVNDERVREKEDRLENMKRQWNEHEQDTELTIKGICQKHTISYVEEVPFKGKPDNTIEIADEYVIFDAKSPANDNLDNFPSYIKKQAESVRKYINQEGVKKDIFLVIPSNTVHVIDQYVYNMGDYNVYVVTKDSLETVILSLKKIEDYEFADQLSPEDRDNICRVIGRFAHMTKRKIQVDQFFVNEFLDMLVKSGKMLPKDIVESVVEYEKAEKLNPPPERRSKQIDTEELIEKNKDLNKEAAIRNIVVPESFEEVKKLN